MPWIHEKLVVSSTNMSLDKVREMDYYDFQIYLIMALAEINIERGANPKSKKKAPSKKDILSKRKITKRFDPEVGDFVDI